MIITFRATARVAPTKRIIGSFGVSSCKSLKFWFRQNKGEYIYDTLSNAKIQANCDKYGRLYDWATAMALPDTCNSTACSDQVKSKHRGICPQGWHIPSEADWKVLIQFVDPSCSAADGMYVCAGLGTKLKAKSGWNSFSGVPAGTDEFGFSALPGGMGLVGSDTTVTFNGVGEIGSWWSATEGTTEFLETPVRAIYAMPMSNTQDASGIGEMPMLEIFLYGFSVRCVQD